MEKLLDGEGLSEVWRRVKERSIPIVYIDQNDYKSLSDKEKKGKVFIIDHVDDGLKLYYQEKKIVGGIEFNTDNTLTLEDDVLSVKSPVKGVINQRDFDMLDPEEKKKGLYFIPGEGGDSDGEIYSTEETRIGTWIDGKPLYRISGDADTSKATVGNRFILIPPIVNLEQIKYVNIVMSSNKAESTYFTWPVPLINASDGSTETGYAYRSDIGFFIVIYGTSYIGRPVSFSLEYTKTTD